MAKAAFIPIKEYDTGSSTEEQNLLVHMWEAPGGPFLAPYTIIQKYNAVISGHVNYYD
jgi:hypothetical protein